MAKFNYDICLQVNTDHQYKTHSVDDLPFMPTLVLVLLILFNSVYAATDPLKTGENLPVIQGETLARKSHELPAAGAEKITFVVFSFTKKGGSFARKWVERFDKEFGGNPNVKSYIVMFLEGVPRLLRGMVSSGIKKGIPKFKHPQSLLIYKDEKLWKERLGVLNKDDPYLVLLDGSGKILWLHTGQFSENQFTELNTEVHRKLGKKE